MELVYRHDFSGLTAEDCAALIGVLPGTWRSLVSRRQAPRASGFDSETGRRVWDSLEVMRWQANRPGRGSHKRKKPRTRRLAAPTATPMSELLWPTEPPPG